MTCKANKPASYRIITGDHRDNVMELQYKLEMMPIATFGIKYIWRREVERGALWLAGDAFTLG